MVQPYFAPRSSQNMGTITGAQPHTRRRSETLPHPTDPLPNTVDLISAKSVYLQYLSHL